MYFVDRKKIETTLVYLNKQVSLFSSQTSWTTPIELAALERITQMMVESVLDVGNAMIDGFIMRDPGSYDDIIDILMDERVIAEKTGTALKVLIQFRKKLVQFYTQIDHKQLHEQFEKQLGHLIIFAENVRDYMTSELGPVSAFKN